MSDNHLKFSIFKLGKGVMGPASGGSTEPTDHLSGILQADGLHIGCLKLAFMEAFALEIFSCCKPGPSTSFSWLLNIYLYSTNSDMVVCPLTIPLLLLKSPINSQTSGYLTLQSPVQIHLLPWSTNIIQEYLMEKRRSL